MASVATVTFHDSQTAVNEAYWRASKTSVPWYVYGPDFDLTGPPYTVTAHQPSRHRAHWRIMPDGGLGEYRRPRLSASKTPEITYTNLE